MTDVAGGLITLEYALTGLKLMPVQPLVGGSLSARDQDVADYIIAATPVIESLVGPVLPVTKTILQDGGKLAVLLPGAIANAAAVTAVRVNGGSWSNYVVNPDSGVVYAGPTWAGIRFPMGIRNVAVDLTMGYSPVPQTLQLAARELVRYWVQIGLNAPRAGALGMQPDAAAAPLDPYAIPRRVRQLCSEFLGGGFA
jgi:hypothetical protein